MAQRPKSDVFCKNCYFYRYDKTSEDKHKGYCNRYPPIKIHSRWSFPETPDFWWCGEFQRIETTIHKTSNVGGTIENMFKYAKKMIKSGRDKTGIFKEVLKYENKPVNFFR